MIAAGLVSISFRTLSPRAVVDLVAGSPLHGIEWGGDVHVPHGDRSRAVEVGAMTREAGLAVAVYGSYYRAGEAAGEGGNPDFNAVLESAVLLGAPTIRVWCGRQPSATASPDYRARVTADLARIGDLAAPFGIAVTCEHHAHTLTDSADSARQLYHDLQGANVQPNWQPVPEAPLADNLAILRDLAPRLANVHAFHWLVQPGSRQRLPLQQGHTEWQAYLQVVRQTGRLHWTLLEFVKDDSPEQFLQDAATLNTWVADPRH